MANTFAAPLLAYKFPVMPTTVLLSLTAMLFLFLVLFLVLLGFVSYNRSRIPQMLYHLGLCRGKELTEREYVEVD